MCLVLFIRHPFGISIQLYSVDIYQFCFGGFLAMMFKIFVQNVVFRFIPHFRDFRGNSGTRIIRDLIVD